MSKKLRRHVRPHPFEVTESPEPAPEAARPAESNQPVFPRFTLEWLLYGLVFLAALGLRWWNLNHYPLSDVEAQQSLPALNLYFGNLPTADTYSPLLLSLNWLAFILFGISDASARLVPVVLGMGLVILPMTLRRQLGTRAALLAAALLALSPTAIFLSRTLNSEVGVAVGALMIFSGFFNWTATRQTRWLYLLAGGLALLLAAGSMAFSIIIVFALIVGIQYPTFKTLWTDEDAVNRRRWQLPGIFFGMALVVLSTAALFNLVGLSMLTGALTDWLSRFSFTPRIDGGYNAVFLLTIYEPLPVFAGMAGLAMTLIRRNVMSVSFSIWFVGLLLLDLLMFGRPASNVILLVVPLGFLAALALAELWQGLQQEGAWQNEGIILASGLAILGFAYLGLTAWLYRTCGTEDTFCQYAWLQSVAALALFLVVVFAFWFLNGGGVALRGAALTAVAVGLLVTINIGWRLNFGALMNLAYQPLAGTPPSTELVMLSDVLGRESAQRVGDPTLLDITVTGVGSPALRWRLQNFSNLQAGVDTNAPTQAIITPTNTELGLNEPYLGQDFALNAIWSPAGLPAKNLISWLIYRQLDTSPEGDEVILWLNAAP